MSTGSLPPPAAGRAGWFADRPLAQKFGVLVGVVVLAFAGLISVVLIGNGTVRDATAEVQDLADAETLVLQLDTRASELKVDGFKALVRDVPADQLPELADGEVRVQNGRYAGYTGIVASVPERDITHPVVRILNDASGERVDAVEIDLAVDRDLRLGPIDEPVKLEQTDKVDGLGKSSSSASSSSSSSNEPPGGAGIRRTSAAPLPPAVKEFLEQFDLEALDDAA